MGNPKLIPYETIVRATSGEPEAVEEVLRHYSRRIQLAVLENGHVNLYKQLEEQEKMKKEVHYLEAKGKIGSMRSRKTRLYSTGY